jgi:cytosine/adenosine deaminase-related metal-dependent hydrolase
MTDRTTAWRTRTDEWNAGANDVRFLHVRRLINPGSLPVDNLRLTVHGSVITDIRSMPAGESDRAWPAVLIPPLVNAHTHLEFSGLAAPLAPAVPFPDWIRAVIRLRRSTESENISACESIQQGIAESRNMGVKGIGEITTGDPAELFSVPDPSIVSFRELIGLSAARAADQLQTARQHADRCSRAGVLPGLSPHAPYSVHPELFEGLVDLAATADLPVAMHLAETQDELELLQNGTGRFADFLKELGLWNASVFSGGRSVTEFLRRLAILPRALAIHCNYLTTPQMKLLAESPGITVVYCPRTHRYFRHDAHPWLSLIQAGVRVVLGTDSRASNPDLNLWRELQMASRQSAAANACLPFQRLLQMVTTDAAEALGLPSSEYTIQVGQKMNGVLLALNDAENQDLLTWAGQPTTRPTAILDGGVMTIASQQEQIADSNT